MSLALQEEEYWDRIQRERDYAEREEERERAEARTALEMAFEETPNCSERCFDEATHAPHCLMASAVNGWLASQIIAREAA